MANDEHFRTGTLRSIAALEPPPDLPAAPALSINAWREIPVHCRDARAARMRGLDEAGGDGSAATSGGVVLDWRG